MPKKYRSDTLAAIYETIEALHDVGAINKQTMREYISQPVFARYMKVSKNLVSAGERGVKKPGGPPLLLLELIQKKGIVAIA